MIISCAQKILVSNSVENVFLTVSAAFVVASKACTGVCILCDECLADTMQCMFNNDGCLRQVWARTAKMHLPAMSGRGEGVGGWGGGDLEEVKPS